jgi:adenosylcobyric acid synthase
MARAVMIQGTGSNVGKSLLVAGLARAFADRGLRVAPFKPQNMSNNAAVTVDGGEIGRAQALQALAARVPLHSDMNPVLLKPESESGAQVIVQGKRRGSLEAFGYRDAAPSLLPNVLESFHRLAAAHDLILVEGAGSPAETNLRRGDIANMGFARAAGVPVLLAGDIDRGGVIAQIVGTQTVLEPADAAMIRGFLINRFRGDVRLFDDGLRDIVTRTGWPALGVVPWFADAWRLPAEDSEGLASRPGGAVKIVVPRLGRIANFDDLDPLSAEPGVTVDIIEPGRALPGDAAAILLPGSKSTLADLAELRAHGWDIDILAHWRRGGQVIGLCGGYQMLGRALRDPSGVEGAPGGAMGLGLLDVVTVLGREKRLATVSGWENTSRAAISGYEIHMGQTSGPACATPWFTIDDRPEGAISPDGRVMGAYIHGIFANDGFRRAFLARLGAESQTHYAATIEQTLDALAAHLRTHLDLDKIYALSADV